MGRHMTRAAVRAVVVARARPLAAPIAAAIVHRRQKKAEYLRKPVKHCDLIESCSLGPYVGLFGRGTGSNWVTRGNEVDDEYMPSLTAYGNHSRAERQWPPVTSASR